MALGNGGLYVGAEHDLDWHASVVGALVREYTQLRLLRLLEVTDVGEEGSDVRMQIMTEQRITTEVILKYRTAKNWKGGEGNIEQFGSYVRLPANERFDLIVVDGRARKACVDWVLDARSVAGGGALVLCEAGRGTRDWLGQPTCIGEADYRETVDRMRSLNGCLYEGVGYGNWPSLHPAIRWQRGRRRVPAEICVLKVATTDNGS